MSWLGRVPKGWGLVAAGFLTFGVSAGMMHSYPVFFVAFLAAFGWGRAEASVAYSACSAASCSRLVLR